MNELRRVIRGMILERFTQSRTKQRVSDDVYDAALGSIIAYAEAKNARAKLERAKKELAQSMKLLGEETPEVDDADVSAFEKLFNALSPEAQRIVQLASKDKSSFMSEKTFETLDPEAMEELQRHFSGVSADFDQVLRAYDYHERFVSKTTAKDHSGKTAYDGEGGWHVTT